MKRKLWLTCAYLTAALLTMTIAVGQPGQPLVNLPIARPEVPLKLGLSVTDAEKEFVIDLDPTVVPADPDVLTLDIYCQKLAAIAKNWVLKPRPLKNLNRYLTTDCYLRSCSKVGRRSRHGIGFVPPGWEGVGQRRRLADIISLL